jgi:hypothetical protein
MKQIILFLLLSILPNLVFAQLSVTDNSTAAQLVSTLVTSSGTNGVTTSNAVLICDSNANGLISGNSNIGISNGIVLGSGRVMTDTFQSNAWGIDGLPSVLASAAFGNPGDLTLNSIINSNTNDACVLEFDLVPVGNFVEFEYVFGSEEYPEFICLAFNDVFGFFISGPGITGTDNMALIPSTTTPVSINSINDGTGSCSPPANSTLYVTNTDTFTTMDGFTTPLIATHAVISGQSYHLKMAIADVADQMLNSYVIITANSLKSSGSNPTSVKNINNSNELNLKSNLVHNSLHINNTGKEVWDITIFDITGRMIHKNKINNPTTTIDVTSFNKGTYILYCKSAKGLYFNNRFVVE